MTFIKLPLPLDVFHARESPSKKSFSDTLKAQGKIGDIELVLRLVYVEAPQVLFRQKACRNIGHGFGRIDEIYFGAGNIFDKSLQQRIMSAAKHEGINMLR
jgi:hypothetical protein